MVKTVSRYPIKRVEGDQVDKAQQLYQEQKLKELKVKYRANDGGGRSPRPNPNPVKQSAKVFTDYSNMKKSELALQLELRGVIVDPSMTKAELLTALEVL